MHDRLALREQAGDSKRHGDAMIAKTRDARAPQRGRPMNFESVVHLDDLRAHDAQIMSDRSDAIGFLDPQFLGVPDDGGAGGKRSGDRQRRKFVDELRHFFSLNDGAFERRSGNFDYAAML